MSSYLHFIGSDFLPPVKATPSLHTKNKRVNVFLK
jgi:hypothetical protein